jgi:hypothetical protein
MMFFIIIVVVISFVNMLLIVCIPRVVEYGDLFAKNRLILKML